MYPSDNPKVGNRQPLQTFRELAAHLATPLDQLTKKPLPPSTFRQLAGFLDDKVAAIDRKRQEPARPLEPVVQAAYDKFCAGATSAQIQAVEAEFAKLPDMFELIGENFRHAAKELRKAADDADDVRATLVERYGPIPEGEAVIEASYAGDDDDSPIITPEEWDACVAAVNDRRLAELATWRGWKQPTCQYLKESKSICIHKGCWGFPNVDIDGDIRSIHCCPKSGKWFYDPPGAHVHLLVLGSSRPEVLFVHEGQWDMYTQLDQFGIEEILAKNWQLVSTRSASNSKALGELESIPPTVYLVPQNDGAGQRWIDGCLEVIGREAFIVQVPKQYKDLNDWGRDGLTPAILKASIEDAVLREPGKPQRSKPRDDWQEPSEDLSWLKFETVDQLSDVEPERVIEGLLHIGEKLGITAGSKSFKTWLLLYIGYCIANGLDFLGFKTKPMKVIFFDLELSRNALKRRLQRIQEAVEKGNFDNIKVCSLRGKALLFCKNFEKITGQIKEAGFRVVVIDPVYKFMLGKNENDNGLVAEMLERLTVFCMEAQVALIYVHHHSKGNQAGKEALDRGSGAGAWSRDPDAVLDLVDHKHSTKEEKIYTAEITVREFPPIDNFVVRWKFPLLVRDAEGLDPTELKQPGAGRPKQDNGELILAVVRAWDEEGGISARNISEATLTSLRTVQRRIREFVPERLVKAPMKGGYQLSLSERQKMEQFKTDEQDKNGTEQ